MMEVGHGEGNISEWNEGNLFSWRLHECKEMINFAKIDPLSRSPDGKSWNYQLWIAGIDILFDEGNAKYSNSEVKTVQKIKELISMRTKYKPPHVTNLIQSMNGSKRSFTFNNQNWEDLYKLIQFYEQKVKLYNDKHGLSTRNQGTKGLFG